MNLDDYMQLIAQQQKASISQLTKKRKNKKMKMESVKSTNITQIGHNNTTMHVTFKNGATYRYNDVTLEMYNKIVNAKSIGSALYKAGVKGVKL